MTDLVDKMALAILEGQSIVLDLQQRYKLQSLCHGVTRREKSFLEKSSAWSNSVKLLLDEYERLRDCQAGK